MPQPNFFQQIAIAGIEDIATSASPSNEKSHTDAVFPVQNLETCGAAAATTSTPTAATESTDHHVALQLGA